MKWGQGRGIRKGEEQSHSFYLPLSYKSLSRCFCCCVPILLTTFPTPPPPPRTSAERIHSRGTGRRASVQLRQVVYSNYRNDVPRVAQRYRTIVAHTRRRASVRVVFVSDTTSCVCSVLRAHAQFCRFDKADATADVQ